MKIKTYPCILHVWISRDVYNAGLAWLVHYWLERKNGIYRACLAQLSFTSKAVFLKQLHEQLFKWSWAVLEKLFGKTASPTAFMHGWEREMGKRAGISYFFSVSSQLMSLWEGEKNSFMDEAVLEMSVWQIKQLTTAREAVASYAK